MTPKNLALNQATIWQIFLNVLKRPIWHAEVVAYLGPKYELNTRTRLCFFWALEGEKNRIVKIGSYINMSSIFRFVKVNRSEAKNATTYVCTTELTYYMTKMAHGARLAERHLCQVAKSCWLRAIKKQSPFLFKYINFLDVNLRYYNYVDFILWFLWSATS